MIKIKHIAYLALPLFLFAACTQEDTTGPDGDDLIAVEFSATRAVATRTTDGGNNWESGDQVGLFMVRTGDLPANYITVGGTAAPDRPYNVDPSTGSLTAQDGGALYYPQSGAVDFIAYYPYGSFITIDYLGNTLLKINLADQTTEDDLTKLDVLYARANGATKSKTPVSLLFRHVFSKITFDILDGDGISGVDVADMPASGVRLTGMPKEVDIDLNDGSLKPDRVNLYTAVKTDISNPLALAAFTTLVIPQPQDNGATSPDLPDYNGRKVVFTVGGKEYFWNIPDTQVFEPGHHYTYLVTVTRNGVSVGDPTIGDWTPSDNPAGSGEAVSPIQPESNCYMVKPGSAPILIPVSQANRVLTSDGLGADANGLGGVTADNFTVELVWGDLPVGAGGVIKAMSPHKMGGKGYIYVEPGVAGNAVIAIRSTDDDLIKWSWHIWVTEPIEAGTDSGTGLTWMDRNLGATSNLPVIDRDTARWSKSLGLFYQWGRKDALPGSNGQFTSNENPAEAIQQYYTQEGGDTPTNAANRNSAYTRLYEFVQNPMTFASSNSYRGSINVDAGNDSWGGTSGAKTLYDPCPAGWRVPPRQVGGTDVWGAFTDWRTDVNSGMIFKGIDGTLEHYYPFAGVNYYGYGPEYTSSDGHYWTANASGTSTAVALYTSPDSYWFRFSENNRSRGFSVRCIEE